MDAKYINYLLLIKGNFAYFFDKNSKLSTIERTKLNKKTFPNYRGFYYTYLKLEIDGITESEYIEFVLSHLKEGDSFEKFSNILHNQETKKLYLTNYVLKGKDNMSYFFDENGIFSSLPYKETTCPNYKNVNPEGNHTGVCTGHVPKLWDSSIKRIKYIINLLNIGDSFEKFNALVNDPNITVSKTKPLEIDQFITKISNPDIRCSSDNPNKNTFDFIDIEVFFLTTIDKKLAKSFIENNFLKIFNKVQQVLKSSKKYKKYDVPINFLKCSCKVDHASSSIHFLFSLKELPEHNKDNSDQIIPNMNDRNSGQDR